jgi:hypothetical protein
MYEHIIFPDYQGSSIANLMQTLASVRGGDVGLYPPLEGLDGHPLPPLRFPLTSQDWRRSNTG